MAANANHGYTCSPAGSNNDILGYDNSDHVKIYSATSAPLELKFDVTSGGLPCFLERVFEPADESNQLEEHHPCPLIQMELSGIYLLNMGW